MESMVQTCGKCSRANPSEAIYCYFDGMVLEGHARRGGPVAVGSQVFPTPFVFPSGRSCRSFDELALACQENWDTARALLLQGFLGSFLGGLGRADLAQAAREAARFPDPDRGLDQLLAQLPSEVLDPPQLRLEPLEVNLGRLELGAERRFDLRLANQGMRLLYGSVSSNDWLVLGEPPGTAEKHFQFNHELVVPVRVRGSRLRAGTKPQETRILVESNGGTQTVVVRAEVPAKPFPEGVLAGARTPRQVAEKARDHAKEAAVLFEKGAVAAWYKTNGWTYPVRGPAASGHGAVQQFFEALGLTRPPRVEISEQALILQGSPGDQLRCTLEVKTQEKRPVYAHASSNQPWLEAGRARLNGRTATIQVAIPAVPNRPGQTLSAKLVVQSNGNQRFVVPVTLAVLGSSFDFTTPAAPPPVQAVPVAGNGSEAGDGLPTPSLAEGPPPGPAPRERRAPRGPRVSGAWVHLLPVGLLALALGGVVLWDRWAPLQGTSRAVQADPGALLELAFTKENLRFGLSMAQEADPKDPGLKKRLTAKPDGSTNNTCILLDDTYENLFGLPPGRLFKKWTRLPGRNAYESAWYYPSAHVLVTQQVEIVRGGQSGKWDTCLVHYIVENKGTGKPKVGLRVLLDTFIGANDGVPFVIPGHSGLMTTQVEFGEKDLPDYVEALEKPDLEDPGTVAHLGLKGIELPNVTPEPIEKMVICHWPGSEVRWAVDAADKKPIGDDSCVFLYWTNRPMNPGERRDMAFTYGVNTIAGQEGSLGLTAGGSFRPRGSFTVTALVKRPREGQTVKLALPPGLSLAPGQAEEQEVRPGGEYSQVSWRVQASGVGQFSLEAVSGGARASLQVHIRNAGIFD